MSELDPELAAQRDRLLDWLFQRALPLWWEVGADRDLGGFHEAIDWAGQPVRAERRARVQARQIFTYAVAGAMGWSGPWREAVEHGLAFFIARYRRDDDLFWNALTPDGRPIEALPALYEQAFALLALASASSATGSGWPALAAEALAARLASERRCPAGGFICSTDHPLQSSDPHMHLLEAAMAWEQVAPAGPWRALADEVAELCLARLIAPPHGAVLEHFDSAWAPAAGIAGRLVSPGHQFEWAGLLERWGLSRARPDARASARRLYDLGARRGIDPVRQVAMFELLDDLTVRDAKARLWSQTEWLKAALILARTEVEGARRSAYLTDALTAANTLWRYLDTPAPGLWRDKLTAESAWVDEPAPASSFYHIIDALRVLAAG